MNALIVLKQDHNNVEELFSRFEHLDAGDVTTKRHVADKIIEHLSIHAAVEEQVFYPAVRAASEEAEDVKWTLSELEDLPATDERFDAKMRVLMESVRHHVEEEETELFPQVREALTNEQLEEMGDAISRAKVAAPVRPHPRQPDTPPLNVLLGLPIAILDRFVQAGREAVDHVMKRAS
jgi:hemerythrin superfamily protein